MEKHILTYASGGADKTAVVITKIRNSGIDVTGEVIYTGADEGAVILEDIIKRPEYDIAIKRLRELNKEVDCRKKHTLKKVERALNITLYDWQKAFIFYDEPYGLEVSNYRMNGKTLAHCLRLCLSCGEPITVSRYPTKKEERELSYYLGEDKHSRQRISFFVDELYNIYYKLLSAGGIDLREIIFRR